MTASVPAQGTRFVVDLGPIALPEEKARAIEAEIRRVVLTALADLDLVRREAVAALADTQGPMAVSSLPTMLPPDGVYGLLVPPEGPGDWHTPLNIDEHPF